MKAHLQWASLIVLASLLSGCASTPSIGEPKLSPSVTIVVATEVARDTPGLSPSLLPSPPNENPSITPAADTETPSSAISATLTATSLITSKTPTLTPTPTTPNAAIQILAPGPASKVISPIHLSAYLKPGAKGKIHIDLLGEDGRLLGRKIMVYAPNLAAHMLMDMDFEIPGAAETGRLVISTEDAQGRSIALASVDVLLMSMGEADINPPGDLLEDIIIQEPVKSTFIQGGKVVVTGLARMHGNDPLLVEMIAEDGGHIGPVRLVNVPASGEGEYSSFTAEVPYSVSQPTWVRLIVYENPGRIPGTSHLSSIEILLGQ